MSSAIWNAIPRLSAVRPELLVAAGAEQARRLDQLAGLQPAPLEVGRRPACRGRASAASASPRRARGTAPHRRASTPRPRRRSPRARRTRTRRGSRPRPSRRRRRTPTTLRASPRRRRAPSTRSSCTSVAMCTSSTATPAGTDGSARAVRKQSSGRSRLPPADERLAGDLLREPRPRRDGAARAPPRPPPCTPARPGVACTWASWVTAATPVCNATIEPPSSRNSTPLEPARLEQLDQPLGRREALHRRRQIRVRRPSRQDPAEQRARPGRTRARRTAAARRAAA